MMVCHLLRTAHAVRYIVSEDYKKIVMPCHPELVEGSLSFVCK